MMLRNYLFLLAIGCIWGSQFIFQQMAVHDLPPIWVGAGRSFVGFITLLLICKILRLKGQKGWSQWVKFSLVGLLEATIPFVFVAWGQQYLNTSVAAILMGTIPFFTIILSPLIIRGGAITAAGLGSIILGFSGLIVLFYPDLVTGSGAINLPGAAAIVFSSACFAIALLVIKGITSGHPLVIARNILAAASFQTVLLAIFIAPITTLHVTQLSVLAVLYLGILCAGFVYVLYVVLIRDAGPVFTSLTNYLVPIIGVLLGASIKKEIIPLNTWAALAVILMAVAFKQIVEKLNKKQGKKLKPISGSP
ncbi:MAG: DMT family transporter [Endozoicomonas sp. (ex Botrylloides leachii)]|nr:DMT family transporter [Endozoicomonas sp. (ex Botrylloides leachii)]